MKSWKSIGIKIKNLISLVVLLIIVSAVNSATSTSNCHTFKNDINITLTVGETTFIDAEQFIDGYNLTYTIEPDDSFVRLKQIFTEVDSHTNNIGDIIDISYWEETNGGGTYALLEMSADQTQYNVYIDKVSKMTEAPEFNPSTLADSIPALPYDTCYGIVLISAESALIDCVTTFKGIKNLFKIVNVTHTTEFQHEIDNWNYKWASISGRNMLQYFSRDVFGNRQLYLIAFTPFNKINAVMPIDQNDPYVPPESYLDMYFVLQNYSEFTGIPHVLQHVNTLDYSDFGVNQIFITDVFVSGNEIFMVDLTYVYRYQYVSDRVQFMFKTPHGASVYKTGYETHVVLALFSSLYEWDWTITEQPPRIVNIYESKLPINFQNAEALAVTNNYIAVSTSSFTNVYQRGQSDFQDLASGITNIDYYFNKFMLFENNYGLYCTNDFYKIVYFLPPQIVISPKLESSQTFTLTAHSMDHIEDKQDCSVTFNVTAIPEDSYGVFNSIWTETSNIYLTPSEEFRDDTISDLFTGPWIQYNVQQNDNYKTILNVDQVGPTNITYVDYSIDPQDVIFKYAYTDDSNGTQFYYSFTQTQDFRMYIFHCGTSALDNEASCYKSGQTSQLTKKVTSLSFGEIQNMLIFSVAFGEDLTDKFFKTAVNFYTMDGEVYDSISYEYITQNMISDVDIIGGYVYINQPNQSRIQVLKCKKGFPWVLDIDADYTKNWVGLDGGWNPLKAHGNKLWPNYLFVETKKAIVTIGMTLERAFFVNTLDVISDLSQNIWSRKVAVGSQSILVAQMNFDTKEKSIKEYDLKNPYDVTITKIHNLYSNTLVWPITSYFSEASDIFYIFVNSAKDFSIFLIKLGENSKLSSLYFNYLLPDSDQTTSDNLFLCVGGKRADYLTIINQKTNRTDGFFVPHRPTLYAKPDITGQFKNSVEFEKYFIQVSVFNGYEMTVLKRNVIIINPLTEVYTFPTNLTLDTLNETVKTFSVSDYGWVRGTILGYKSQNSDIQLTNQVTIENTIQIDLQDSYMVLMTYSQKYDTIIGLSNDYQLFTLLGNDPSQTQYPEVTLPLNRTQNPICNYLISIQEYKNDSSIVFCKNTDLFYDRWQIYIVDWTNSTTVPPQSTAGILLDELSSFNGEAMFYQGLLYVLNSTEYPNENRPGRVMVYSIDRISNTATKIAEFQENDYGIPYNFDIFAFELVGTNQPEVSMIVLLESYGHSLYFGSFNQSDPSDFIWSFQLDFQKFLNENFIYLSENTYLYDIELVKADIDRNQFNINTIGYTFIITTSDTSIFEVFFQFNTKFTNGTFVLQTAYVTQTFVNYGSAQHLFDVQVLNTTFGITYYNRTTNSIVLGFYNASNYGPPHDPTQDTPSTIMSGGLSFPNVQDPYKHAFVLYLCGDTREKVCALSSNGDNNAVSLILIRDNITLTVTGSVPPGNSDIVLSTLSDYAEPAKITITLVGQDPKPTQKDDDTDLTALWITLGVLGGVVLIGGLGFWWYQKRMIQQDKLSQLHEPMSGDIQDEQGSFKAMKKHNSNPPQDIEPDINKGSQDNEASNEFANQAFKVERE